MSVGRSQSMPIPQTKRPSLKHSMSSKGNAVTVCVRIRPPNSKEIAAEMRSCFEPSDEGDAVVEIDESYSGTPKTWPFDYVFGPECDNEYVFGCAARPLVESALDGYNTVLFMYGQTSSGKTFTLFGGGGIAGLVDHCLQEVNDMVMKSPDTEYVIKMNFIELYNEELKDLLSDDHNAKLNIIEDAVLGPLIQNITEVNFTSVEKMRRHLDEGDQRRHFGVTNMNAHSSRSHVMVRLSIESRKVTSKPSNPLRQSWGKDKPTCYSTLNLVDLAGSERANKSGTSGQSLKEGSYINKSLLTLGTVISALSEGNTTKHIPYRDSKLTRLLASALGGNAKTTMITCVSPASGNIGESHSTLRFASRAKRIVNHVRKNEFDDAKSLAQKLAQKEMELETLRSEIESGNLGSAGVMKEKILIAQRKFRSLKFLVKNSSQLVKSLNKVGKVEIAKQVRDDVRGVLEGSRALDDVLEEHSEIMSRYLGSSEKLLRRVSILNRVNSTDSIGGDDSGDEFDFNEGEEEEYFDDFQNDEHQEEVENLRMSAEDLVGSYENKIQKLHTEQQTLTALEKRFRQKSEDLTAKLSGVSDELNTSREHFAQLKSKHDRLLKQSTEDMQTTKTECDNMSKHVKNLENLLNDKEKTIEDLLDEVAAKNEEKIELNTLNDTLQKQLQTANTLRSNFENEAKRIKADMRAQMERLRSTMSNVLQQGEGESKVLEMQNAMLFNDLKAAQDEIAGLKEIKAQVDDEMSSLRKELGGLQQEAKDALAESKELRTQLAKSQQFERLYTLEMTKLQSKFEVSEMEALKLRERLLEESSSAATEMDKLKKQLKEESSSYKGRINDLENEIALCKANAVHDKETIEAQQVALAKMEQANHFDILKLEKKMADQLKSHEDINQEHVMVQKSLREKIKHLLEQKLKLNEKITSQDIWIASVNQFLDCQPGYGVAEEGDFSEDNDYEDDRSQGSLCATRQVSFSFDGYSDDDGMGERYTVEEDSYKDDDSWLQGNSPYPSPTKAQTFGKKTSTPPHHNTPSSQSLLSPHKFQRAIIVDGSTSHSRLADMLAQSSARFNMIKLGLQTATAAMTYVMENELLCHQSQIAVVSDLNTRLESRTSESLKRSVELEAITDLKERIRHNLVESQNREVVLEGRISELEAKLREAHSNESTLHSSEEVMTAKFVQLEYDRSCARAHLVKVKAELTDLREDYARLEKMHEKLSQDFAAQKEGNIILASDLDLVEQRMSVVLAERDELVLQFVKGGRYAIDENGLESLYSANE